MIGKLYLLGLAYYAYFLPVMLVCLLCYSAYSKLCSRIRIVISLLIIIQICMKKSLLTAEKLILERLSYWGVFINGSKIHCMFS